jgi:NAD(P)H-quinone oxidoreductase subunit 4L
MNTPANGSSSKNSLPMVLGYAIVVVALLSFYLGGGTAAIFPESVNYYAGSLIFGIIAICAVIAINMGGSPGITTAIAAWGSFIALTADQDALTRYLTLAAALFSIGVYGMTVSRNAVRVLMSIELMLNAVNINLVAFARYVDPANVKGQIFAIFILTVAAAEAAVGLAIVLSIYRNNATVDMERFNLLKW